MRFSALALPLILIASGLVAACDPSPGEVREWAAGDHDQPANASTTQGPAGQRGAPQGRSTGNDSIDLTEVAWQKNCVTCHGRGGAGDGPQGPMLHAPDLTRPEWQDKVTDTQIAATIRTGKNKMPAFDLPAPVLDGLVKRVRGLRGGG